MTNLEISAKLILFKNRNFLDFEPLCSFFVELLTSRIEDKTHFFLMMFRLNCFVYVLSDASLIFYDFIIIGIEFWL